MSSAREEGFRLSATEGSDRSQDDKAAQGSSDARHRVRLPRFITVEPAGLGDAVKKVTTAVGVKPCSACQERAARLNQWVQFVPRR
jgi:hypothetical protein